MFIVGDNLEGLIESFDICPLGLFDRFSININIDNQFYFPHTQTNQTLTYGRQQADNFYKFESLESGSLELQPGGCALACSSHSYNMPLGYIGLTQTKGTLARMFVSSHCTDSQIEPGFHGKITLELVNHSPFPVKIPIGSPVAQLFIARCSTDYIPPYDGKYREQDSPTLPEPFW